MSSRMTALLGWLTLLAILGMIWVLFGEDPTREQGARGEKLFAVSGETIDAATTITLTQGANRVVLNRSADRWVLADRNDYPANQARVRALLAGLYASERREPKTANLDSLAQLGLGKDALSINVGNDTGALMSLDVGKQGTRRGGKALTYVFKKDDSRAWLVTALPDMSSDISFWLEAELSLLESSEIALIQQAGATLVRATGSADFALEDLTEGENQVPGFQRGQSADVLAALVFDDVAKVGNPPTPPMRSLTVASFGGLVLTIDLFDRAPKTDSAPELWARIKASEDAAFAESLIPDQTVAEPQTARKPGDMADRIAKINQHTSGWLFKLRPSDAQILMRDRDAFLQKPPSTGAG